MMVASIVAYVFMTQWNVASIWSNVWRVQAMVVFPFIMVLQTTQRRTMIKYFPWTRHTFYLYKVFRFIDVVGFTITIMLSKNSLNYATLGYFVATQSYVASLFAFTQLKEVGIRAEFKKAELADLRLSSYSADKASEALERLI